MIKQWIASFVATLIFGCGIQVAVSDSAHLQPLNSEEQRIYDFIKSCDSDARGISQLIQEMPKYPDRYREWGLDVLGRGNGEEVAGALLRIASGSWGVGHERDEERAAVHYLASPSRRSRARDLFGSGNSAVWQLALNSIEGSPVDADLLAQVERSLASTNLSVRYAAMRVVEKAPESAFGTELAQLVLQSLTTITNCPGSGKTANFYYAKFWTKAERSYRDAILTLVNSTAFDTQLLTRVTPPKPGLASDCLTIARGWRGDAGVRAELYRILEDSRIQGIRHCAVEAFYIAGRADDIANLARLARSDPFEVALTEQEQNEIRSYREFRGQDTTNVPNTVFPIREMASNVVDHLKRTLPGD